MLEQLISNIKDNTYKEGNKYDSKNNMRSNV